MKIQQQDRQVQSSSTNSKAFSIQASGKMFHMVISGLYSDKPTSITREIYSNAFDAHAMVGKEDVPFDVVYPTTMDPTFTVRDYGPGIPHDKMEEFYTVLGHSTKEDTNVAVGKWGVGRMSPMSYTDSFSVVSRHRGLKAFYSVQKGADGSPSLHTMAPPHATDEPDGLEVSFPIDRYDVSAFSRAARRVSLGFKVKPNVVNDSDPLVDPKVLMEGDTFQIIEHPDFKGPDGAGAYARMGCVLYKVDGAYVPNLLRSRYDQSFIVEFPIGDLDVTASREDLSYDETTVKNLKKGLEKVKEEIHTLAEAEVQGAENILVAHRKYSDLRPYLKGPVTYKGVEINSPYYTLGDSDLQVGRVCTYGKSVNAGFQTASVLHCGDLSQVFVQDLNTKTKDVRAAQRVLSHPSVSNIDYWIKYDSGQPEQVKQLKDFLALVKPFADVVYVKDIPDPGPRTGTRSPAKVKTLSGGGYLRDYDMSPEEFQKGGVYVKLKNKDLVCDRLGRASLVSAGQAALGLTQVICVPKTLWKRFEDDPNWELLEPKVRTFVETDTKEKLRLCESYWDSFGFLNRVAKLGIAPVKPPQKRQLHGSGLSRAVLLSLLVAYGKAPADLKTADQRFQESVLKKYPLLRYYSYGSEAEFKEYVRLVDAQTNINLAA